MIKYIQMSLIPDPAMDAKESQEGLQHLVHKVDDYESENLHSIQNNLQNQNVLNRLKLAEKWPPGDHAVES